MSKCNISSRGKCRNFKLTYIDIDNQYLLQSKHQAVYASNSQVSKQVEERRPSFSYKSKITPVKLAQDSNPIYQAMMIFKSSFNNFELLVTDTNNIQLLNRRKRHQVVDTEKRRKKKLQKASNIRDFLPKMKTSKLTLILSILLNILILSYCDCDIICPKDLTQIYPCTCNNGTIGSLIKCSNSNLPTLSSALRNYYQPVEQLEIENSPVSRVSGALFNDSQLYNFHSTIRELDIRNCNLREFDIKAFSQELNHNIQFLMFDANKIQSVPSEFLQNIVNLKLLNLSTNYISSVENNAFVKLTNLSDLDLSQNRISKLSKNAFSNLYQLEYLNLNLNDLSKLEKNLFTFGRKLKVLDLSNNKLTNIDRQDFNELTSLEVLRISNNLLTTIPRSVFSRNAKLYSLDLSFNKFDDIDTYLFKSVRFLRDLSMNGNLIKEITKNTFSSTTRLRRLNLSQNSIQSLAPETFKGLEWLDNVDLSHNQIVNISNDAFRGIYSVNIDLSFNKLTRIFYYSFHEVSNITKLNLSNNLLDEGVSLIAFEQTDSAILDLSYNQIQDLSKIPISNLTGIRILDIKHNQITELNKKSFTQKTPLYELHTIDASFNNISQITGNVLERLRSIRYLNVSHNSLRRLNPTSLGQSPTLLELDLSYNNIVDISAGTLGGLISLKHVNLSYNKLKKMPPISIALSSIDLTFNEIGQLSKSAFPTMNALLSLELDNNRISNIEDGTFQNLLALNTLSLRNNNLNTIPVSALKHLTSLQTLFLDGNNISKLTRKAFGVLPIVFNLHLSNNNISIISNHAFDGLLQLLSLNISHNNIQDIPPDAFSNLVSLQILDVSHNLINRFENQTKSAMEDLLSLEVANFSSNKLSIITPRTFLSSPYIPYRLKYLDLSNNLIGILANNFANGLRKVEWLSLKSNIINDIVPKALNNASELRYLDLSHNKMRSLKHGTFDGQFVNLTTLLLNNNKLISLVPEEFDKLKSLKVLDLSSNKLETFYPEAVKWIRRGVSLDMRDNNLECTCNMLPFVAWIDSIRYMSLQSTINPPNSSYNSSMIRHNLDQGIVVLRESLKASKFLSQYYYSSQLISNTTCSKPEILNGKRIVQMLDAPASSDFKCDQGYIDDANKLKRIRAPIQFTSASSLTDDNQGLRIGWVMVDPQVDILNFVLLTMKLSTNDVANNKPQRLFNIKTNDDQQQQFYEFEIVRIPYSFRAHTLKNIDSKLTYVICILFETYDNTQIITNMIEQSKQQKSGSNGTISSNDQFDLINLSDYTKVNCAELNSLLHHDNSERLISSSADMILNERLLSTLLVIYICIQIACTLSLSQQQ